MNEYIHMLKKRLHNILLLHVDSNSLLIYDKSMLGWVFQSSGLR